jgi:hypothetical protein
VPPGAAEQPHVQRRIAIACNRRGDRCALPRDGRQPTANLHRADCAIRRWPAADVIYDDGRRSIGGPHGSREARRLQVGKQVYLAGSAFSARGEQSMSTLDRRGEVRLCRRGFRRTHAHRGEFCITGEGRFVGFARQ